MTSTTSPGYPADYYYPEFINSRPDDPILPPTKPPPLSGSVSVTRNLENRKRKLASNVVTDQGLPELDINNVINTDPKKSLIRDPTEKNIPKLTVNDNFVKQVRFPAIPTSDIKIIPNGHANSDLSNKPKKTILHQPVTVIENDQWKKPILPAIADEEPSDYDKPDYEGPFGLTRKGSFIFFLSMTILTLLGAIFLIMTGIFYANNYPSSSSSTGELAGIGVCAFAFYLGLQLILIGIWHQKYRYENPVNIVKKKPPAHYDSGMNVETAIEDNVYYDYPYQQPVDYSAYGYYPNPPYVSTVNEKHTGSGYYEPFAWPATTQYQTQPDPKFSQAMEWSMETRQHRKPSIKRAKISPAPEIKKSKLKIQKTVNKTEPIIEEFDSLPMDTNMIEKPLPLPDLPKAPETTALIQLISQMEPLKNRTPTATDLLYKKSASANHVNTPTDVSSSNSVGTNHKHRHHRHHHHHHHKHRPHHHHHHSRHHRHHHHRSRSPCSECSYNSRDHHQHHQHQHHNPHHNPHHNHLHSHAYSHHYHQPVFLPRLITPNRPKVITPTPRPAASTTMFRETAMNTGHETKIMRDSGVTANLDDLPSSPNNRLERIPVVRRTVIVEPYPAQPSSQIFVKPQENMVGKIRLTNNTTLYGDNEALVHPTTAFFPKKTKKMKKSKMINHTLIEDLRLDDLDSSDRTGFSSKTRTGRSSTRKSIKNAFYN